MDKKMGESGTFYCKVCDIKLNSQSVWESHITGKKHLKTVKNKEEADCVIPAITRREGPVTKSAIIEDAIKEITEEPVIGLDYIFELQYTDSAVNPSYTCGLCNVTIGVVGVIDHIVSVKHRLAYIKENDKDGHLIIESMLDSKIPLDGLAQERAKVLEEQDGRGSVEVKLEESKFASLTSMRKRPQNEKEDSGAQKKSTPQRFSANTDDNRFDTETKEFFGRIPYLDVDKKLGMIEELSTVKITNDEEAREAMTLITNLSQILMQFKTRYLQSNPQQRHAMRYGSRGQMGPRNFPGRFQQPGMGHSVDDNMFNSPMGYPQPRPGFRGRGRGFM